MSEIIYRQDAVNALYRRFPTKTMEECAMMLQEVPSAEPEQKCKSCRYHNLEWYEEPCDSCTMGGEDCHYKPERKKGKWIGKEQYANSPEYYSWQCSYCGCVLEDPTLDEPYLFCPNCGADMRGEQE